MINPPPPHPVSTLLHCCLFHTFIKQNEWNPQPSYRDYYHDLDNLAGMHSSAVKFTLCLILIWRKLPIAYVRK